jgi:hypothetical protein
MGKQNRRKITGSSLPGPVIIFRGILIFIFVMFLQILQGQTVQVQVDASLGRTAISPYIYGKNNDISDNPGSPTTSAQWELMREAGLRFTRENGGNNASKYNWKAKLSSHPDWYNNVYAHDWDYAAGTLTDSLPGVQGMWAFQLIGKAASNTSNNFNDYAYNGSASWSGTCQNLAGGGTPNGAGGCAATINGNPSLYLENWTSDSSVAILSHWFGSNGLGYPQKTISYWSMDNEPDLWSSTHDDIITTQPTAEAFMQLYFTLAKKARALYPAIKLTGPVPANEWQWYSWNNSKITDSTGASYVWLEYFIKRISEEQKASGIRLLDVIDIHSYPGETADSDLVMLHRIYFDSTYNYPGANGVKTTSPSGWDNSITHEYIFGRCNQWLNQYLGPNHGVTCGISEFGAQNNNANITAISYASMLGTFADNQVGFFSPWYWYPGMWETLHLFSRYSKAIRIQSVSGNENDVSAYSSVNNPGDSVTILLVNRNLSALHNTTVNLAHFNLPNGTCPTLQLSNLPSTETFLSNTNNALLAGTATITNNSFNITLPSLSTTAIILKGTIIAGITPLPEQQLQARLYPNPVSGRNVSLDITGMGNSILKIELCYILGEILFSKIYSDQDGQTLEIPCANLLPGIYTIRISSSTGENWSSRLVKVS